MLRLRPGMARATAVVAAGIALTVLVGLSRVYLDVHYLSDVSAGWALGAAAFALLRRGRRSSSPKLRQNPPAVTAFALAKIGHQYFLFGVAGADLPGRLRRP